jgi:hypothetical protein
MKEHWLRLKRGLVMKYFEATVDELGMKDVKPSGSSCQIRSSSVHHRCTGGTPEREDWETRRKYHLLPSS